MGCGVWQEPTPDSGGLGVDYSKQQATCADYELYTFADNSAVHNTEAEMRTVGCAIAGGVHVTMSYVVGDRWMAVGNAATDAKMLQQKLGGKIRTLQC